MSLQAAVWALEQPALNTNEAFVLMVLGHHAGFKNECFPSIGLIAQETKLSKSTTIRVLHTLEAQGFITRSKRWRQGGGQAVNSYTLNIPQPESMSVSVTPMVGGMGVKNRGMGVNGDTHKEELSLRTKKVSTDLETKLEAKVWFQSMAKTSHGQPTSPRIVAYEIFKAAQTGMLTIDAQIDKFCEFNSGKQLTAAEWQSMWRRWCDQAAQFSRKFS